MLQATERLTKSAIDAALDDYNAFVEKFQQQYCDRLAEFQDRMSSYENQADEMLTKVCGCTQTGGIALASPA